MSPPWSEWLRFHQLRPRPGCDTCLHRVGHWCGNRALAEMVAGHSLPHDAEATGRLSLQEGWRRCHGSTVFYRRRA